MNAKFNKAEVVQQKMQSLRQKNELFFKKQAPEVFNLIDGKKSASNELKILESENDEIELDVIEKGKSRYFNAGMKYCEAECDKFLKQMREGTKLPNFIATKSSTFKLNRVGSLHFKKLATLLENKVNIDGPIEIPEFYPMLVVMGVGIGKHIERLVTKKDISSLIIYENNLDRFLTSLYCINWEFIYSKFDINKGKTIQIILSNESDYITQYGILWNELVNYCPHFPYTTLFYNHLNDTLNSKIIAHVKKDLPVFLQQWGHYDDEINQYNNARHNLLRGAKLFKPSAFTINHHIPVAVIGAGPSLDDRIEILKKYKGKLLIISCGTTIGTLYKHNIKPDFHVELESDYVVHDAIKSSTNKEFRKGIVFIGSAQVNTRCLDLFDKSCIFFKDSSVLAQLFLDNQNDVIMNTTPSCTNAGCAIAVKLGFKNILLFGTDFGFINKDKHHATGSVYYQDEDDISFVLAKANKLEDEDLTETISVTGEKIKTKPFYYTCQLRLEEGIKFAHKMNITVRNCSDGASIRNTIWTPNETLDSILNHLEVNADPRDLAKGVYELCQSTSSQTINNKSDILYNMIKEIFRTITKRKPDSSDLLDISRHLFIINNIITKHVFLKMGNMQYFLRGQMWIYLTIFFTYSFHSKKIEDREFVTTTCLDWLIEHQAIILKEMSEILYHEKTADEDEWINKTVIEDND